MGHLMFNAHVQCGIWYADDVAHIVLLSGLAPVLAAVRSCAYWTRALLCCAPNIVGHEGSEQRLYIAAYAYVWVYICMGTAWNAGYLVERGSEVV